MDEIAVRIQHEEMRIARDLRPPRQECLVAILLRVVDLDPYVATLDQRLHIGIRGHESIENVAPPAPFAAHVDDHSAVR